MLLAFLHQGFTLRPEVKQKNNSNNNNNKKDIQQTSIQNSSPPFPSFSLKDAGGNVRIWATDNADKTLKLELRALSGCVKDIAWSDDSKRLVVVGDGKDSFANVFIWDSGSTIGTIGGHSKCINAVDWKQTRPYRIATASEDFLVNFYEGPPFKFTHSNRGHTRFANCVRFSPDGNRFVSVGSDIKCIVYDGKTGLPTGELQDKDNGHKLAVYSVSWSPDSKQVITTAGDKTAKIWDVDTLALKTTFAFANEVDYMQVGSLWVPSQIITLSLNGDLNYLDPATGKPSKIVYGHNKLVTSLAFDRSSNTLYSASTDGVVIAWEAGVGSKAKLSGKGHTTAIPAMHVRDGKLITCGKDDAIRITETASSFAYASDFASVEGTPQDLAVGKTDSTVFVAITTKSIAVIRDGKVANLINVNYTPTTVDFSGDDSEVAIGATDMKIRFYAFSKEDNSLTEKATLGEHRGQVSRLRFSPCGTMFASGDSNRELIVWDASSKTPKYTGLVFHNARILDIAWSPDSSRVATGSVDTNVIVWNLAEKTRLMAKSAHPGGANAVVFINENTVASAGGDCCIKTWKF